MKKEFIPYEQALALKELRFDEPCLGYYHICNTDDLKEIYECDYFFHEKFGNFNSNCLLLKAPLFKQAFRWFREKYKLHSTVDFDKLKEADDDDIELYEFKINEQWTIGKDWYDYKFGFKHQAISYNHKSYEEAEFECLKKLIEIVKNKL